MATFSLSRPEVNRAFAFPVEPTRVKLTEKYRPASLSEVVGQGYAVMQLQAFARSPYPTAFLFSGDTGLGKTTCARALANDMGMSPDWDLDTIESGQCVDESLDKSLRTLRQRGLNGWRMLIIDEADTMSAKCKQVLLSALEDLPQGAVVVLTTNNPAGFPQRLMDRCEHIRFESDCSTLLQDAQLLVNRVYLGETGHTDAPDVADLPNLCVGGAMSFRRVVNAIGDYIASRPTPEGPSDFVEGPDAVLPGATEPAPVKPKRVRKPKATANPVDAYLNRLKNPAKKAYAIAYAEFIRSGRRDDNLRSPDRPEGLSAMGAQSVRVELTALMASPVDPQPIADESPTAESEPTGEPPAPIEAPSWFSGAMMIPKLPREIRDEYPSYDAFGPDDPKYADYTADPVFVYIQDLGRSIMSCERTADDGSLWRVRATSPRRNSDKPGGTFAVLYCPLPMPLDPLEPDALDLDETFDPARDSDDFEPIDDEPTRTTDAESLINRWAWMIASCCSTVGMVAELGADCLFHSMRGMWDAMDDSQLNSVMMMLDALGYPRIRRPDNPDEIFPGHLQSDFDRLSDFIRLCVTGSPVDFPVPPDFPERDSSRDFLETERCPAVTNSTFGKTPTTNSPFASSAMECYPITSKTATTSSSTPKVMSRREQSLPSGTPTETPTETPNSGDPNSLPLPTDGFSSANPAPSLHPLSTSEPTSSGSLLESSGNTDPSESDHADGSDDHDQGPVSPEGNSIGIVARDLDRHPEGQAELPRGDRPMGLPGDPGDDGARRNAVGTPVASSPGRLKVETSDHTGTRYNVMVEILGGPGSYADVVEIRGEKYWIAVSPDGIEFSRPEHGPHYILDGPNGLECSCHSFFHRPGPCKHVIFVVEHGYLPIGWEVPDLATINPPREPQFSATTL